MARPQSAAADGDEAEPVPGQRAYWLARSEGFAVLDGDARVGVVESVQLDANGRAAALRIRSGLLVLRTVQVSAEDVVEVDPRHMRLAVSAAAWRAARQRHRHLFRRDFRCTRCGYGAVAIHAPSRCPMCGGDAWSHVEH